MIRRIAFTALSAAIVLGGAAGAIAASKKNDARHAYAAAGAQQEDMDPREAYMQKRKGGDQTWCDADPECNGWAQWMREVSSGKRKAE
jgi:hypothetical protein